MKKITISSLFLFVLVMSSVSAVTMGLSGTVLNSSSENADGNLTVSIYEVATGGSAIYSENFTITNGSYNVMLGVGVALDLVYGNTYYLDLLVNGDDMDFNGTDRQQFVSNVGNVSGDGTGGWDNDSANTSTSLNVSINGTLNVTDGIYSFFLNPETVQLSLGKNNSINTAGMLFGEKVNMDYGFAFGSDINATGSPDFVFGNRINVAGGNVFAFGNDLNVLLQDSFVFGEFTNVSAVKSVVFGPFMNVLGNRSVVFGRENTVQEDDSFVFASGATTTAEDVVVFSLDPAEDKTYSDTKTFYITGGNVNITNNALNSNLCLNNDCITSWPVDGSPDGTGGWVNNSENTSTNLNVSIGGALVVDGNDVSTTALVVNGSINISDVGGKLYVPRICLDGDCRSVWSNGTYNAVNGAYLYALSSTIYFNETKLNATITALSASDTQKNASGYLYNDSTTIYLNETLLNATIDARHDGTGGWVNDSANTSTNLNVVINNSLNVAGQVTLNDLLQLNATTTPGTCNGTVEGAIFYNATSNMPCYCNGTAWNLFNGSAC